MYPALMFNRWLSVSRTALFVASGVMTFLWPVLVWLIIVFMLGGYLYLLS